jgi:ABC-type lipoprotein export system ATPase subunit
LVLRQKENNGVVILHATCAFKNNQASIIIGSKGAGKSTTLLEFVQKSDYKFMSGIRRSYGSKIIQ